ncbi:hypothetical protein Tco_0316026 [Tanacetum coccineum]
MNIVNGVLARSVDLVLVKDFASFALEVMKIHPLMILIQILSLILQKFHPPSQPLMLLRIDIGFRRECEIKIDELKQNFNGMSIEIRKKEKELLQQEQAAYVSTSQRFNFIYDDDDDEESSILLSEVISKLPLCIAITPVLSIMEPVDSLIMEDEHLDTIPATKSDELIKSSVENLVPIPSESEDFFDIESECDVPDCDDSQTTNFSTFSNPLFDDSTSSDDESSHEEVIHEISFKTYSNPLFDLDEEIISSEFNPIHNEDLDSTPKNDCFDTES